MCRFCYQCFGFTDGGFEFEVWLVVDRNERPDLIEKARKNILHTVVSPYTGKEQGMMDVPLLIFQPDHEPALLFSPAQQTTQDQYQQVARQLIDVLRQNLGTNWRDEWLSDGLLAGVERSMLPIALSDDPEAALKKQPAAQEQQSGNQGDLQRIFQELQQPPRDIRDMPRRIELCQQALRILFKEGNERLWAALQNELAVSLAQSPLGNRAQNIEQAIQAYQASRYFLQEMWR